jgi:hypothetical protein
MSEQTIQSQDIKVADVFQSFYVVPDYQREYVWETDQVEQLLTDVHNELAGADPAKAPEYFIGSIVVCPAEHGVLDLIDGQQRMTTLFLTLCAIRDRFKEMGQTPPGALGPQIAATSTDASGFDQFRYRLDLQYEDSGDVLERIAKQEVDQATGATRSITNILNAYQVAMAFLRREFGDDQAKVRAYYGYLTNKVKLIRIQTEDVAKALKIFETINDRGVGLDAMDLLKNLLFMKADRDQFDKLKKIWKEMQDTIYGMGEKPLRFLRYFIFSRFDVDLLREDQIYSWFAKNEKLCKYGSAPVEFAKELLAAAQAYRRFLDGHDHRGKPNRYLENLQLLGGKAARQHLILLLAGRHLPEPLFDRLAREVENLFFVYVVTREATRDFERSFARWSADLRKVTADAEFQSFIEKSFGPAKAELGDRFDDAIRRLYVGSVQQYRLRYILAKLTQHVDLQGFGETEGTKWLSRYTSNGFEIEHVYPQTPSEEAATEFGTATDANIANRLGNLVLVEKSINASLGNRAFSKKRAVYLQSQVLLTRAVAERPKVGVNTKIDAAVAAIEPFDKWNEEAVIKRQEMIRGLARTIWDVPTKAGS